MGTETGYRGRAEGALGRADRRGAEAIPIFGHRYVVAAEPSAVLSVHGSDIVAYGEDLRSYLLAELSEVVGLVPDEREGSSDAAAIPFWGAIIDG